MAFLVYPDSLLGLLRQPSWCTSAASLLYFRGFFPMLERLLSSTKVPFRLNYLAHWCFFANFAERMCT